MKLRLALGIVSSMLLLPSGHTQTAPSAESLAAKTVSINRKMVDQQLQAAQTLRTEGNLPLAVQTTVSVINQLAEHGYEQDSLRLMREMTLDAEPAFSRAGSELLAKYYYQKKYLVLTPADPEWLLEARAWAVYSGNQQLTDSFKPRADDEAHRQAIAKATARGEELKADDRLFLAFEMIRANRRTELRKLLQSWPYSIDRAHSQDGTSLLHKAVWYKKTDIARMLVDEFKADINVVDQENDTPLDYAQYQQAKEIVDFLASRDAKANKQYGRSNASRAANAAVNETELEKLLKPAATPFQKPAQ